MLGTKEYFTSLGARATRNLIRIHLVLGLLSHSAAHCTLVDQVSSLPIRMRARIALLTINPSNLLVFRLKVADLFQRLTHLATQQCGGCKGGSCRHPTICRSG